MERSQDTDDHRSLDWTYHVKSSSDCIAKEELSFVFTLWRRTGHCLHLLGDVLPLWIDEEIILDLLFSGHVW